MNFCKSFTKLFSKTTSGKITSWEICVKQDNDHTYVCVYTGQVGGKIVEYKRIIESGKNIGKKNETTILEQAILEATSMWKQKKDKNGYRENIDNIDEAKVLMPMCAEYFDKRSKHIDFTNAFVQPKLDGVRCILLYRNNEIKMFSKNNLEFYNLNHIKKHIKKYFKDINNIVLDGELYTDNFPFNKINGYVRRQEQKLDKDDLKNIKKINFQIFDCFNLKDNKWKFTDRFEWLKDKFSNYTTKKPKLFLVETIKIESKDDVFTMNNKYVENGFEGIIIRNGDGLYKNSKSRSNDLQKFKLFKDDEFEIVNFEEGDGQDKGTVIWVCITKDKKKFKVRPKGTIDERKKYFIEGHNKIGKKLTVKYQEMSEDGVPRFPVGLRIREID